jgi:hypothetical protein
MYKAPRQNPAKFLPTPLKDCLLKLCIILTRTCDYNAIYILRVIITLRLPGD